MFEEGKGPVVLQPEVFLGRDGRPGPKNPPPQVETLYGPDHGYCGRGEAHLGAIQSARLRVRLGRARQGGSGRGEAPGPADRSFIKTRPKELPAKKGLQLADIHVGPAQPLELHELPGLRIVGHARPGDGRQEQNLDRHPGTALAEPVDKGGHGPVGAGVGDLAGVALERDQGGEPHRKAQAPFFGRGQEVGRAFQLDLHHPVEIVPGEKLGERVPDLARPVDQPVDPSVLLKDPGQDRFNPFP